MGGSKPKPSPPLPFSQQQQQRNTFDRFSIADSPEAKALLETPLDFGSSYAGLSTDVDVDPGVGRRTDLAEQSARNRWDSAFNDGIPREYRMMLRDDELRNIRGQGAAEAQAARFAQQTGQRDLEFKKAQLLEGAAKDKAMADLERKRILLPQYLPTGGSGSTSGFNTQVMPGQQGFWQSFGGGLGAGIGGSLSFL